MRKLKNATPYKCSHCLKTFTSCQSFMTHLLINSRRNSQKNLLIAYSSNRIRKSLVILKKMNFKEKCSMCDLKFYMKTTLKKHLISHLEFKCFQCNARFKDEYSLVLHKDVHLRQKDFSIPIKSNKIHNDKDIHIPRKSISPKHDNISIFQNPLFNSKLGLNYVSELKCKDCRKIFFDKFSLIKHAFLNHTAILKDYACPLVGCLKVFKYKANWLTHVKMHSRNENITCNECSMTFMSFGKFDEHVRTNCINRSQLICSSCQYQLDKNDYAENVVAPLIYQFINKIGKKYECTDCLTNRIANALTV